MDKDALVAAVQMSSGPSLEANLAAAQALLEDARSRGATLAVLPENFALMGAHESDKLAVAEDDGAGPIQAFLARTARELKLWIVGGTIPMRVPHRKDRVHAASLVYDTSGQRVARYDKIHLFDVELGGGEHYRESASIEPGALQAVVVNSPVGTLGLSVCYDLRFPELYRQLVAGGAQVLLVPSAFTERTGRAHWDLLLRARAVENLCYVVAPNQCGTHPGSRRTWGHSGIFDPWGVPMSSCDEVPGVAVAPVSLPHLQELRAGFPALAHRRLNHPK